MEYGYLIVFFGLIIFFILHGTFQNVRRADKKREEKELKESRVYIPREVRGITSDEKLTLLENYEKFMVMVAEFVDDNEECKRYNLSLNKGKERYYFENKLGTHGIEFTSGFEKCCNEPLGAVKIVIEIFQMQGSFKKLIDTKSVELYFDIEANLCDYSTASSQYWQEIFDQEHVTYDPEAKELKRIGMLLSEETILKFIKDYIEIL